MEITFHEKPWRHYKINPREDDPMHPWSQDEPWGCVPSVSAIVGIIDKSGPLQWYAARVTREGIIRMLQERMRIPRHERALHEAMKREGLTYQQVTHDAADRGTAIHKILEDWIDAQAFPTFSDYPEAWHGWIRALAKFLRECEPEFHESEIMVGSAKYGFAGRRDTVATCVGGKGKLTRPGRGLLDLKTSKAIYPASMFAQLEGYDLGGMECGEDPTDYRAIVQVGADGEYNIGYSCATHDDFLAYLAAFNAQRGILQRAKAEATA